MGKDTNYRPRLSDDQVLKLASLIESHLMSFTDNDLEELLDRLQEQSKTIRFKEWEIEQELAREKQNERKIGADLQAYLDQQTRP